MTQQQPSAQHPPTVTPAVDSDAGSPSAAADYRVLDSVPDEDQAHAMVNRLSDEGFPVKHVRIVGTGLRTEEQVVGRMSTGRAVGRGALLGLGFGLLFGVVMGLLFSGTSQASGLLQMMLVSLVLGPVCGAVLGGLGHASTRGRRDFRSVRTMDAETYEVQVDAARLDQARQALGAAEATSGR